jgi:hypothetical protein
VIARLPSLWYIVNFLAMTGLERLLCQQGKRKRVIGLDSPSSESGSDSDIVVVSRSQEPATKKTKTSSGHVKGTGKYKRPVSQEDVSDFPFRVWLLI